MKLENGVLKIRVEIREKGKKKIKGEMGNKPATSGNASLLVLVFLFVVVGIVVRAVALFLSEQ